ncbi:MAG: hypothetical protein HC783_02455, partial [Rhodobacteraceae bacterium]|nr:hypothetical protein [Paracoccaceae bacterium]
MLDIAYPMVTPGPPRPSRILTPKSLSRHAGQERHVIPGGGALLLQIAAGDRLMLVNDEGGQPCEVIAATKDGQLLALRDRGIPFQTAPDTYFEGIGQRLGAHGEDVPRLQKNHILIDGARPR